MSETKIKPLNWEADPEIGYSVERRPDGGMNFTFTDTSPKTLEHWRNFSMEHLLDSDRLTRNLYDLRQLDNLPEEAIQYALEVNNDPNVRNIRLAAVATNEKVREAMRKIGALPHHFSPMTPTFCCKIISTKQSRPDSSPTKPPN